MNDTLLHPVVVQTHTQLLLLLLITMMMTMRVSVTSLLFILSIYYSAAWTLVQRQGLYFITIIVIIINFAAGQLYNKKIRYGLPDYIKTFIISSVFNALLPKGCLVSSLYHTLNAYCFLI